VKINSKYKKVAGWILRVIILGSCFRVIWQAVSDRWSFDFQFTNEQIGLILLGIILMPINWGLEVWRWKRSLDSIEKSSWKEAGRQVFSGLTLNWILPFTSGDLIARLTPNSDRKKVGVLILYNRGIMLLITGLFGAYGIYVFSGSLFDSFFWQIGMVVIFLVVASIVLLRIFRKQEFPKWVVSITIISGVRYLIFTFQFVLLLYAFIPELSMHIILAGVGWTFFFRSVIPSLFGNLGVREVGALVFFESYVSEPALILIPSLLIWLINTVAPSVLGLYYILRFQGK